VRSRKRARAEARVHLSYTRVTKFYLVILLYRGGVVNEIIYILYKYVVRENIGVNFGFIEELSKTPSLGERGKQTLYKGNSRWRVGRVGIERVFFFENNNRTRIAVETKTTLINTSLLRSHQNKSLMTSIFFVCSR